jgi:Ca2+/Na+ antiporter
MKKLKYSYFLLFIIYYLGGAREDNFSNDVDFIRIIRIIFFIILFLFFVNLLLRRKNIKIDKVALFFFIYIGYTLITIFWAPQKIFAVWKIFEILLSCSSSNFFSM